MLIILTLIAFRNGANLEFFFSFGTFVSIIYFDILVLNTILEWGWKGTRPTRLGRWGRFRHWCFLINGFLPLVEELDHDTKLSY